MNKLRAISVVFLVAVLVGCSTQKNYFVKFNPADHKKISAISLWIEHNKNPKEDPPLMKVRSDYSGTYAWPLGASKNWSPERYKETLNETLRSLRQNLASSYPDDSIVEKIFFDIASNTNHIPINIIYGEALPKGNDTHLKVYIYHKVRVSVSSNEPDTYMGVVAKMSNSEGTKIYYRRVFTPKMVIHSQLSQDEYNTFFVSSLQNAIQIFWKDISGSYKKDYSNNRMVRIAYTLRVSATAHAARYVKRRST